MNQDAQNGVDVCFISMPFTAVFSPSIGIALLQGALHREGYSTTAYYPSLDIIKSGIVSYSENANLIRSQYSEWLFAEAAFREARADSMLYLLESCRQTRQDPTVIIPRLQEIKQKIPEFIEHAADIVIARKPQVVAATSMFFQHIASLAVLRRIKEKCPGIITLIGGANCDMPMGVGNHRHFNWLDYVLVGEADNVIVPLTELALKYGTKMPLELIPPGVLAPVHRQAGYPDVSWRSVPDDLDSLPVPDYTDYFAELQRCGFEGDDKVILLAEGSRGCWWAVNKMGCKFCSLNTAQHTYRIKSSEKVMEELGEFNEKYTFHGIEFTDNALPVKYFSSLLPKLAEKKNKKPIFYEIRANGITRGKAELLHRAGIKSMQIGVEALNEQLLKIMNKGTELWENIQALKFCACENIIIFWNLLFNVTGEKTEYYYETIELSKKLLHINAPTGFVVMQYHRYSPFFNEKNDLVPHWRYAYLYPLPPDGIAEIAYCYLEKSDITIFDTLGTNDLLETEYYDSLKDIVAFWKYCTKRNGEVVLIGNDTGEKITVIDTRPKMIKGAFKKAVDTAVKKEYTFSGIERELLIACDLAPLAEDVYKKWPELGRKIIADFIAKDLVVDTGGRIVGLTMINPQSLQAHAYKTLFS